VIGLGVKPTVEQAAVHGHPTLSQSTRRALKIAHCSDIHLDGDHHPHDHYRDVFSALLDEIQRQSPDLLLIAGDLFDANDATESTILWSMETLAAQPFPIAMIPGNHDCLDGDPIYRRHDFDNIANVDMFAAPEGELRQYADLGLSIWGKGMIDHTPEHRPLGGCPPAQRSDMWFLGMAHGIYVPAGSSTGRSSQIAHEEIEASPCDYLAFGHHHAALTIDTPGAIGVFCGSPTDTIGGGATYAIIDLVPTKRPGVTIKTLSTP
jgi:DNA repair exonuclease SbcCD nuclease subunit